MEILTTIKNDVIRREWDEKSGKWYFSIADSVGIVAKSTDARNYWKVLKNRLNKTQNKLVTECNQLKMKARDGKFYLTDVADQETILKIIDLISKDDLCVFRQYFDNFNQNQAEPLTYPEHKKHALSEPKTDNKNSYPQPEDPRPNKIEKMIRTKQDLVQTQSPEEEEEFMLMIDGYHTDDSIIIKTFIGGINIDDLLISATPEELTITGERKNNLEKDYLFQEIYWGKFSRSIKLPYEVYAEKVEAVEKDGLLTIKLPLVNLLYTKKVKIKSI